MPLSLQKWFVFPSGVNSGGVSVKYCDLDIKGSDGWSVYPTASNSSEEHIMDLTPNGGNTPITLSGLSCVSSTIGVSYLHTAGTTATSVGLISILDKTYTKTYTTSGTFTCDLLNKPSVDYGIFMPQIYGVYDATIAFNYKTLEAPANNGIYIQDKGFPNQPDAPTESIISLTDFTTISDVFYSTDESQQIIILAGSYQAASEITINTNTYSAEMGSSSTATESKLSGITANSTPELFVYSFNTCAAIVGIDLVPRDLRVNSNNIFIAGNPAATNGSNNATFYHFDKDLSSKTQGPILTSTGEVFATAIEGGDVSGVYVAYVFTGTVTCSTIKSINFVAKGNSANCLLVKYNSDYKTVANYYIHQFGDGTTFFTTSRIRVDPHSNGYVWLTGAVDSGTFNIGSKNITVSSNKSIWVAGFPTEKS